MPKSNPSNALESGIAIIHANQLEALRDVVEYWLREHPLAPLEAEIFLVQSNGMGQWLKQSLAQNSALGIAAAINMQLPSLFIWSVYRAVLGAQIPLEQPLAKIPLLWRLYRLLPILLERPEFAILANFLADDQQCRKRYQLAEQLADLFDQYQVYRSDWISAWAAGESILLNAHGEVQALPETQQWQAALWRAVLADLGTEATAFASRASVHALFMTHIDTLEKRPAGIPRRIMLFGLSSLPQQALEVFAKLGKFCQIVLFVHNPCQHYWADIIEDKELLKAERRRHAYKSGMSATLSAEELHLHAPPLLAAWGKQGRDYIRLLDYFDEIQGYANWQWPDNKIDVFNDYGVAEQRSLLQHLQQTFLDLEPIPEQPITLDRVDNSIAMHIAHSPQREVEILHDQLLARIQAAQQQGQPLLPRDIIVMVPDINLYAPHIRAVFGLLASDDPRYIPFSLADQQQRGENPLLLAVEALLNLPQARFSVSELLALLEVPALRMRFGIDSSAIPKLHQWIEAAGIRWGLNAAQRSQTVAMPEYLEANTWQFGLRRMLLGYAVGAGEAFADIQPYPEIGGLDAQWLGALARLLETLEHYTLQFEASHSSETWTTILQALLADFFSSTDTQERKTLDTLTLCLSQWHASCILGGLSETDLLPLAVVREAWLSAVDVPSLQQRFLTGRVNFCTLMPMRAIPFKVLCLLGMNDGDYPRNQQAQSFDLMSQRGQYRPGDRSRRQDDQYLFLEAILSAREQLYISWVGRSIRDNSERPPSVLISQLREVLAQSWRFAEHNDLLEALTLEHPLQPFSADYVASGRDPRLFTYAQEWFAAPKNHHLPAQVVTSETGILSLSLGSLAQFLRSPVKAYCQQTLKFGFDQEQLTSEDNEPFAFEALQRLQLSEQLLAGLLQDPPAALENYFDQQARNFAQQGLLPLAGFAPRAYADLMQPVQKTWQRYQALLSLWPNTLAAIKLQLPTFEVAAGVSLQLTGELPSLRTNSSDAHALVFLSTQSLKVDKSLKHANLLGYWVQHLAACAADLTPQTLILSADTQLQFTALSATDARGQLSDLVTAYYLGMQTPLPLAAKTAFVWLESEPEKARVKAQTCYEGDDWHPGEVAYDPYLTRFFPSFAELMTATEPASFTDCATTLYQSMLEHLQFYSDPQDAAL